MTTRYTVDTALRWRPATHPRRVNTPLDGTNRCRSIRGISRHTEIVGPGDSEREWPTIVIVGGSSLRNGTNVQTLRVL